MQVDREAPVAGEAGGENVQENMARMMVEWAQSGGMGNLDASEGTSSPPYHTMAEAHMPRRSLVGYPHAVKPLNPSQPGPHVDPNSQPTPATVPPIRRPRSRRHALDPHRSAVRRGGELSRISSPTRWPARKHDAGRRVAGKCWNGIQGIPRGIEGFACFCILRVCSRRRRVHGD